MFSKFKDKNFIFIFTISVLFVAIIIRLLLLQVVKGKDYLKQSLDKLTNSVTVSAPRGIIYDRNGVPLITNKVGFSIQVVYSDSPNGKCNDILLSVTNILKKNGDSYVDSLPISQEDYSFTFKTDDYSSAEDKEKQFKKKYGIAENADGKTAIKKLAKRYGVDSRYHFEQIRQIVGVRYELETRGLGYGSPVTIASDVSIDTVSVIKENNGFYSNINVVTSPFRNYVHGSLASHILGRVGVIYQEEYEKLKSKNYGMNDIIGKDGMEKHLEQYIRGTDGRINRARNIGTNQLSPDEIPALPGNNAILTIDYELQSVAEKALKDTISNIRAKGASANDKVGADAGGGAVVVIDVNTGEILAMASYPDFEPSNFDRDYEKLSKDQGKPMFNRAISGTYPPGSVFKILTALAGLEEGVVSPGDYIRDEGQYEYFGQKFNCWIWTQSHATHGMQNVRDAIQNSCNYYFYEVGKRLGEKKIYDYATKVGLGQKTGIEIPGESQGILANEDYKRKVFDQVWYPGDTLQMAIGQSFNLFTPLQMASYIATIANGGTRYRPHLTKEIRDYYTGDVVKEFLPEKIGSISMKDSTYKAIIDGMYMGSRFGTSSAEFADFPIDVCCKTGSSQVDTGSANGIFATFAPYDNPQIAIAVVVENAGSGSSVAPVAKRIYERYFNIDFVYQADKNTGYNNLIQ